MDEPGTRFNAVGAAALAGCTYRQLDYWCRIGALRPEVDADGSGSRRLFTPHQVAMLAVVAAAAPCVRTVSKLERLVDMLVQWDHHDWAGITLLVDIQSGEVWLPGRVGSPAVAISINLDAVLAQVRERAQENAAAA